MEGNGSTRGRSGRRGSDTGRPQTVKPQAPKGRVAVIHLATCKTLPQSQPSLARPPSSQHHWSLGNGPICEHLIAERGSHLQTTNRIKVLI